MSPVLLAIAVSVAWLIVAVAWARRQPSDSIKKALKAQEEAVRELGEASEDFRISVENALKKLGADDNPASGDQRRMKWNH